MKTKRTNKKLKRIRRQQRDLTKYEGHPVYYVGYGSNHNVLQMQARCSNAMPACAGWLPEHRLVFSGVLTVEPCKGSRVPVSVWKVTPRDIAALDVYEGFPTLYSKRYTHVTISGERVEAFYYVLNAPYREEPASQYYYATVEQGYQEWGLDLSYLVKAQAEAREAAKQYVRVYPYKSDYFHPYEQPTVSTGATSSSVNSNANSVTAEQWEEYEESFPWNM